MRLFLSITACVVLLCAAILGSFTYHAHFSQPKEQGEEVAVTVEPGSSVYVIANLLKQAHVLPHTFGFRMYARLTKASTQLQAGSFLLKPGMNYAEIIRVLTQAQAEEVVVTIPEGYTLAQIGMTVRTAIPSITQESWDAAVGPDSPYETHAFVLVSGKPDDVDLEGYLFPDTYRFFADASAEDVVKRMLDTMAERYAALPNTETVHSTHELLTLASIVEREVRSPDEMADVADIFWKRLDIGMMLQADSTVNYVTNGDDPSVSYEDLEIDSPYNTYKYAGLPPGPISNPGLNALSAVLNPHPNDWYYFLTTPEGEVVYARTFNEHIANRERYLR